MLQGLSLVGYGLAEENEHGFQASNPATDEALPQRFFRASPAEIDAAVRLASQAAPTYAALGGAQHAAFLAEIARQLEQRESELTTLVMLETALPETRVKSELARTTGQLRLFADVAERGDWQELRIDHGNPQRQPQAKPDLRSMLQPLGPVAVFGASNFPLAFSVAGGDTASALAAGCPVVVKAHPAHPGTSELVGRAIVEAALLCNLPEGVFSLLFDDGISVGQALVRHAGIKAVGFTGSLRAGRALMDAAAERHDPIPVYAEMGSINPVVLLPQALAERAEQIAYGLASSMSLGHGQLCTKPGLILALESDAFRQFKNRLPQALLGLEAAPMLSKKIAANFRDGIATQAAMPGVEYLYLQTVFGKKVGAAVLETDAATLARYPELAHEVFGPTTLLVRCPDKASLLATLESLSGQLTATVHAEAEEMTDWPELLPLLSRKAGRVLFGGFPTGVEVGHAMVHGGPYPATSDGRSTSVGTAAITRFARPVCYQNWPDALLPPALRESNPLGVWRLVDGERQR